MASGERGGIILGWMFRLLLALGVFALGAFEAGTVVVTRVQVDDAASAAALAAANQLRAGNSLERARSAADAIAAEKGAAVVEFDLDRDRTKVIVTLQKRAGTVLVHRIGPLEKYSVVRATQSSPIQRR